MQINNNKKFRRSVLSLLIFISTPAFSAMGHVYLGASGGASFVNLGNSNPQIAYESGVLITDAYPVTNNGTPPVFSVNGGYEFASVNKLPAIALGLGVYSNLINYPVNGRVIETALGDTSNTLYDYRFHVHSTHAMVEMQMTWALAKLSPFVHAGIGSAWNQVLSYREIAIDSTIYPPLPPFQAKNNLNFAYQFGCGLSTGFNFKNSTSDFPKERIAVGYRFVNLGKTSFGTRGFEYPYSLNFGDLQTNEIYLGYTHLFS